MYFTPHTIYVRRQVVKRDEYNRAVATEDEWVKVCECRCDDSQQDEIITEGGKVFRPRYHIVCPKDTDIPDGTYAKVYNTKERTLRGEGRIYNGKNLNYLPYSEFYI